MPTKDKDKTSSQGPGNATISPPGTGAGKSDFNQRRKLLKITAAAVPAIMTLRSGAAAAMASVYQCLNHPGADTTNIDLVLGDEWDEDDDSSDLPHDEWVRMAAKPGKMVTFVNGKGKLKTVYCLRANDTSYEWDEVEGWIGYFKNKKQNGFKLRNRSRFMAEWPNATAFYCLPGDPSGWNCVDETGAVILPTIPDHAISRSEAQVYLLVNYDQETGILAYYPVVQEVGVPITGSCLCSIDPTYQL